MERDANASQNKYRYFINKGGAQKKTLNLALYEPVLKIIIRILLLGLIWSRRKGFN